MKSELKPKPKSKERQQTAKVVNRSILNKSPSKQLPFFSKAQRFPAVRPSTQYSEGSRSQSNRSTARINKFPTIPQAERVLYFDQEKQLCLNPSPQEYHVKSREEMCRITHRGTTMGIRFNSLPTMPENTPSAGDYQNQVIQIKKSFNRSFTFERSQRNLMKMMTKKGHDSPGPIYDIERKPKQKPFPNFQVKAANDSKKGKGKKNRLKPIALQHTNRFSTVNLEKQEAELRQQPKEKILSIERGKSIKRNIGFSTTQRLRVHTMPQKNPGPGSYIFFSEFTGWM